MPSYYCIIVDAYLGVHCSVERHRTDNATNVALGRGTRAIRGVRLRFTNIRRSAVVISRLGRGVWGRYGGELLPAHAKLSLTAHHAHL